MANAMKRDGVDVCSFAAGEPDFATPSHICDAAKQALDDGFTRYTAAAGWPDLRTGLSEALAERYGLDYGADEVIITVGGKHGLFNLFLCLLDRGDEVIIPAPYWVSYPAQVRLAGGEPVIVEGAVTADYKVTPAQIEAVITPRTRILVLNSPSNPTGAAYSAAELAAIAEVVERHDLFVISDEIYSELTYDGYEFRSFPTVRPGLRERTAVVSGWSKTYAMTGWRLGWVAAPRAIAAAMGKLQSQSTSNVPTMCQVAALAATQGSHAFLEEWLSVYDRRRRLIVEGLNAIEGVSCPTPRGAFYVFPDFSGVLTRDWNGSPLGTSLRLAEYLLQEVAVALVPGEAFGAPGCARLSYATSDDVIVEGLRRITNALS
jgi:aspartate aminotransferase